MIETLLYGTQYDELRKAHLEFLRRVLGSLRRADHTYLSYTKALKKTKCQNIETTIRKHRLFFAGAKARQNKGRLPSRKVFTQVAGDTYRGFRFFLLRLLAI